MLIQLLTATARPARGRSPCRGVDPRHAEGRLRGWPLGLARTLFTVAGIRRVIGLLEPGKLDVLHLHLTDGHSWRLPAGRPARSRLRQRR